ncbi:MAG: hypothetical protein JSV66_10990 [Trueperaceae bacterium]|nr:MAG: hypothetical protein JSV66_10990 [Trueperaceae bacterium]
MNIKRGLIVLVAGGLLIGTVAGAQGFGNQLRSPQGAGVKGEVLAHRGPGFGPGAGGRFQGNAGPGRRGFAGPGPHFALGSTLEVVFYDGDPEEGANVLETLTLTVGEDSESAFAQAMREARFGAAFLQMNISEQTRTIDLSAVQPGVGRNRTVGLGHSVLGRNLNEGSSVEVTFYDADPESGAASALESLNFTLGQDSAIGFMNDVRDAASEAAYAVVITSPQTHTVDLTARQQGSFGNRRGDFGRGFGGGFR